MANELRVRANFIGGSVGDNPLLVGATTLTSPALAAVPVIGSTQHFPIVLDPDSVSGAPEIAYITSHAASASTATILRGQEGSTARQHALNTSWIHGPLTTDYTTYGGQFATLQAGANWSLFGTAQFIANGVQLVGSTTGELGAVWYATPMKLDGLTLQFTATLGVDTLQVMFASSATNPAGAGTPAAGIHAYFETYYNATTPDGATGGFMAANRLDGTAYTQYITDTKLNLSGNGQQLTNQLINVQVRQLTNRNYEIIMQRATNGLTLRAVMPSPTDTVYLGFLGNTGGLYGVNSVTNLTATYNA